MTELNTGENTIAPSSSHGFEFYIHCAVIIMGGLGTACNSIVLYALVASGQHKKYILIVYQNAFDFFASLFLMIIHFIKLFDIYLTGSVGYWLCVFLFSNILISVGSAGSKTLISAIAVERYLKIVHPALSKKILRNRMVYYLAVLIACIVGFAANSPVFLTTAVIDGVCYSFMIFNLSATARMIYFMWNFMSFYVIMLFIFIFCYWRILIVIRRQATVMAGHSAAGPSAAAQTQSNQARNNVVSTMILVSAFYAISHLSGYICFAIVNLHPYPLPIDIILHGATFLEFSYVCICNPLIYAANFNPVKKVLLQMIRVTDATGTGTT